MNLEPYTPRPEDIAWAQQCLTLLKDKGIIGTSIGAYQVDKQARTLTLLGGMPDDAPDDKRETHWKHLYVWEQIGYQVLPELRKGVVNVKTAHFNVSVRMPRKDEQNQ